MFRSFLILIILLFSHLEFCQDCCDCTPIDEDLLSENDSSEAADNKPLYFVAVDEMPEPINGIQGIQEKIIYSEIAARDSIEGKVYLLAFIDEEGDVVKTVVAKGLGYGLDESASYAVEQTKFKPGRQGGKPVRVQVLIPIVFKLK